MDNVSHLFFVKVFCCLKRGPFLYRTSGWHSKTNLKVKYPLNVFKYGPNPASLVYFRPFLNTMTIIVQY